MLVWQQRAVRLAGGAARVPTGRGGGRSKGQVRHPFLLSLAGSRCTGAGTQWHLRHFGSSRCSGERGGNYGKSSRTGPLGPFANIPGVSSVIRSAGARHSPASNPPHRHLAGTRAATTTAPSGRDGSARVAQSDRPDRLTHAIIFDIDGVLIRGKLVLEQARAAMSKLLCPRRGQPMVPVLFVTNGGGHFEAKKARQLTEWLGMDVRPEQVVLAHSPMRALHHLKHRHILVCGQGPVKEIALSYGMENVTTLEEVSALFPLLDAFDFAHRTKHAPLDADAQEAERRAQEAFAPIDACFVMSDPLRWESHLQLLVDVLTSDGIPGTRVARQAVQCYFSNDDFVWMAEHSQPRFGAGAFRLCLETLFKEFTGGQELEYTRFGKPYSMTYELSDRLLAAQARDLGYDGVSITYAIGDNPRSDVRGANSRENMRSVLVRTGVFDGKRFANDPVDPADHVLDDVLEAVEMISRLHPCPTAPPLPPLPPAR